MKAFDSTGNLVDWDGNRWNPAYTDDIISRKFLNGKVKSYHFDGFFLTNKDFVADY